MAAITRLGYDGYGVRRAGGFDNKGLAPAPVAAQIADVSIYDYLVTLASLSDNAVTIATLTEWPV